ncbi:MAG: hypothetical protein ABI454_11965 [Sphingomicrobium sp.]
MIYKRVAARLRAQDWVAITIELGIVVVGVFLGTQANNWNQSRLNRVAADEFRREIIDDLENNEADLKTRAAYYRSVRTHAVAAHAALEAANTRLGEPFLIDAYRASQVWLRPLVRTGYDEMTGAGFSGGLANRETRQRLSAYYTQMGQIDSSAASTTQYRERLRHAMPYEVQLAVMRHCGDQVTKLSDGSLVSALPATCTLGLDRVLVAHAVARLQAADLGEDLTRHVGDIDQRLAGFEHVGRMAHENRLYLQHVEAR